MKSSAAKIQMTSFEDLFGSNEPAPGKDSFQEIVLTELYSFKDHPFHVVDDEKMQEMVESVTQHGVLVPGIVRPRPEGGYELVAGHRRKRASELAGLDTMPVFVRDLNDDEAVLIMVDSNLQREKILPSEKAFAYKMKLEAMKRHAGRPCKNGAPVGPHFEEGKSRDILAEKSPDSKSQIQRYIRLTELLPGLLRLVDEEKLPLRPAVEISYLIKDEQKLLLDFVEDAGVIPSLMQAQKLREYSQRTELTRHLIEDIMSVEKSAPVKITLKKKRLYQYFPQSYTQEQMEDVIFSLLETWKSQNGGGKDE